MIRQFICNPVVRLLVVVTAILCYAHSSAHAQESRIAGMVTPNLIFSTYLGGKTPCQSCSSADTFAQNTATDAEGNTYVTGATTVSDLPVLNAWQKQPATGSTMSAFVAKYGPAGKLIWCTYLGGDNQSMGIGAAVMPDGGVAVVGLTSSDSNGPFPTTSDPYQAKNHGKTDYFVTVFDRNGNVRYSTYLGGSDSEGDPDTPFADNAYNGDNIAADAHGLVYVTGYTDSGGGGSNAIKFPVTPNAIQEDLKGGKDAFLSILDPRKSGPDSLVYSSFLGGTGDDKGHGVAVNACGSLITVVGFTSSSDFPTTANAYRSYPPDQGFQSNGFVAQFMSIQPCRPSSYYTARYVTYLGGKSDNARDDTYGVALDPWGLIVVTGRTESADFPMNLNAPSIYNSAPYLGYGNSSDEPYLVKINPSLSGQKSLVYSTFLGGGSTNGDGGAWCTSAAVDFLGTAYVGGETYNTEGGILYTPSRYPVEAPQEFPYTQDAMFTSLQGSTDAMFMGISPDGRTLIYSTFFGGKESDRTYGLAVDPAGNVVLAGLTFSSDFPLKNPAQKWPGNTGSRNAFVSKFTSSWGR